MLIPLSLADHEDKKMRKRANRCVSQVCCAAVFATAMLWSVPAGAIAASPLWKNEMVFPDEPFRVVGTSADDPDWINDLTCLTTLAQPRGTGPVSRRKPIGKRNSLTTGQS